MIRAPLVVAWVALSVASCATAADRLGEPGSFADRYLTVGEVRDVLHKANPRFQACFFEHLGPAEPGDVTLSFEVRADGGPEEVFVEIREDLGGLRSCLADVAYGLEYQDHDGDTLAVAYPLVFVQDDEGRRLIKYPIVFSRPRPRDFVLIHLPPSLTPDELALLRTALFPPAPGE